MKEIENHINMKNFVLFNLMNILLLIINSKDKNQIVITIKAF